MDCLSRLTYRIQLKMIFEQTLKWFDILATLKLSSTYSDLESNDTQPVVDCTEPNVRMRNYCKQSCSLATELDLEYHA